MSDSRVRTAPALLKYNFLEARFFGRARTLLEESPFDPLRRFIAMSNILPQELSVLNRQEGEVWAFFS